MPGLNRSPTKKLPIVHHLRDEAELRAIRAEDPNFSGTLAKGLMILQLFVHEPRPHANSELAAKLGLPRPTVSRLCRTLLQLGYLDHDERLDRYFIGPAAVALGYPYVVNAPLLVHARRPMQSLADQARGAVSMGVAMELIVVYVDSRVWERGTRARPAVGAVRSVAETAMGRAWLATLPAQERARWLRRMRRERPEEVQRCAAGLEESLSRHAERGFAVSFGDAGVGLCGVGVASRLRYGARQLLFNCAIPASQLQPGELVGRIGPRLLELVRLIERNSERAELGGQA